MFVDPLYFPSTVGTWEALGTLGGNYLVAMWATTYRVVLGMLLGIALGVSIGVLMHASKLYSAIMDPFVEVLRPVPALALIPFFILWFGLGDLGKILLIALGGFVTMVVTTYEALTHVSPTYVGAARTLGAGKLRIYRTIYLPAILPAFWSGVRVSAATSFGLGIAAEFMGAQEGLGYLILLARRTLHTEVMLLGVLGIGLLSFLLDRLIRWAGRRTTQWASSVQG
ncbi:ABC transporter permease [Microbacterium soli]|uniref:ABC transporter permease n=1 Tax=Microbacterium soli TaxID=446075 RepID=A0ABP7N4S9_9MICO